MKAAPTINNALRGIAGIALLAVAGIAQANPTAPVVVNGTATFATSGNLLNVTNSPNAIINWGSFSIGAGELTRFIQQSSTSAVLNRVTGQDPSAILGALQSNGRVFLLNPNGIVFGAGSQVNVAGLVASTLALSDADFLAGRLRFTGVANAGTVVNQGAITAASGGQVYLVGSGVTNGGVITAPSGEVVLAAGNSVELVDPGTPNLRVEIVAPDNEVRNLDSIVVEAGRIGIYAGLINSSGMLNARSAVTEGGRIMLKASQSITLSGTLIVGNESVIPSDGNITFEGTICPSSLSGGGACGGVWSNLPLPALSAGPPVSSAVPGGFAGPDALNPAWRDNMGISGATQQVPASLGSLQGLLQPSANFFSSLHGPIPFQPPPLRLEFRGRNPAEP